METLQNVEWLDPLVDKQRDPELERYVAQKVGSVPFHAAYLAACPWILRADMEFDIGCVHVNDLAPLVYLTVSRDNSCRFCHGAARVFMRIGGMSDREVDRLEEDIDTARVEPRIDRALDFARKLSRSKPPPGPGDRRALLEVGFSEEAIRELALFAGVVIFHNRFGTLLALPAKPTERLARNRLARFLRFFVRRLNVTLGTTGTRALIGEAMSVGPYGSLTAALDGLPTRVFFAGFSTRPGRRPRCPIERALSSSP